MARTKGTKKTGGRKKGVSNKATLEIKTIIDNHVNFSEVVLKLLELVNGVNVQEQKGMEMIYYSKPPDPAAAKILLEYRFGKPSQSIDMNLSGDTELNITRTIISKKV